MYLRTFRRLHLERARPALAAIVKGPSGDDLPSYGDFEALIPPQLRAWVRRAPSFNLQSLAFYSFDAAEVRVLMVAASPPVPVDE